jgi:copper chaperone CopZ
MKVESRLQWGLTPLLILLMWAAPAQAQVEDIKITVEGMSCNLCAAGLERSLRKVDGVAGVTVVLQSQTATIRLKPGAAVAPARIRAGVHDAGQRLRIVELRLRGALQHEDSGYQLQAAGQPRPFALRDDVRLGSLSGQQVRVRARVVSTDGAPIELELIDIQPS